MDITNIINYCLLVVGGIGVIVTIIATLDARKSRKDAADSAEEALTAQIAASEAAQRSADALERQAAAAEAGLQKDPWRIERASNHRWKITNDTGGAAEYVRVQGKPPGHLTVEDHEEGLFFEVPKGASVFIGFGGGVADPSSVNVTIDWKDISGVGKAVSFTLPQIRRRDRPGNHRIR